MLPGYYFEKTIKKDAQMQRILLVVPITTLDWGADNSGGIDSVCQLIVSYLTVSDTNDFNYRVLAFDPTNKLENNGEIIRFSQNVDVVRYSISEEFLGIKFTSLLSSNIRVAQQVKIFQPDLVHVHLGIWAFGSYAAKRCIVTLHSYKNFGRKSVNWLNDYFHVSFFPKVVDCFASEYTVVGNRLLKLLTENTNKKISIVHNPIDKSFFKQREPFRKSDVISFVTCGVVTPKKRFEYCIEFISKINRLGIDACLTIIGPVSDSEYYRTLISKVKHEGLNEKIFFSGKKNRRQIIDYYEAADIGIFLSAEESFGLAPLEMLAAGLPVISTVVGVFEEYYSTFVNFSGVSLIENINHHNAENHINALIDANLKPVQDYILKEFSVTGVIEGYQSTYGGA